MKFNWTSRPLKEWRNYFELVANMNWMQTWSYAQATHATDRLTSRLGLVTKSGQPMAVLCVQEINFGPIQIVNLKRGPLWLVPATEELFLEFAKTFREEFPKKMFQRLRWMPEMEVSDKTVEKLSTLGFRMRKENFVTSWLDLAPAPEILEKNLNQKWRNCLGKSFKSGLEVKIENNNTNLEVFLQHYNHHQQERKYRGPTNKFLKIELENSEKTRDHFFLWAFQLGQPVAGMIINTHGKTAAYRIGWNTETGRNTNAHYLLIWKAVLICKQMGLASFDLGGLLPDSAEGVTHFKKGLSGQEVKLITLGN